MVPTAAGADRYLQAVHPQVFPQVRILVGPCLYAIGACFSIPCRSGSALPPLHHRPSHPDLGLAFLETTANSYILPGPCGDHAPASTLPRRSTPSAR
jgi:hypothetical protein